MLVDARIKFSSIYQSSPVHQHQKTTFFIHRSLYVALMPFNEGPSSIPIIPFPLQMKMLAPPLNMNMTVEQRDQEPSSSTLDPSFSSFE
ncbi:unnamed protein product [Amoebophrya sp. A25]|nr:unnamed protein product [Amoebophrya sp. A25]|eukprot:GSA25T00021119001.1